MTIAENIRAVRLEAGLTQSELAQRLRASQQLVSRLESPTYQGYTVRTLQRLAKALGKQLVIELR